MGGGNWVYIAEAVLFLIDRVIVVAVYASDEVSSKREIISLLGKNALESPRLRPSTWARLIGDEFVAYPRLCQDVQRMLRVNLDLVAKLIDEDP